MRPKIESTSSLAVEDYQSPIAEIIRDVFRTMLDLEVHPTEMTGSAAWPPAYEVLTAAIYFAGGWKGALLIECSAAQAVVFTERLMGVDAPPGVNDDVYDALGELANMIGGNLKAILPVGEGGAKPDLSMPSVVKGVDYSVRVCGGNLSSHLALTSDIGEFWVTLVEMAPKE